METIKEVRKRAGLSQGKFADALNVPVATLQNWEQGRCECPPYLVELIAFRVENGLYPPAKNRAETQKAIDTLKELETALQERLRALSDGESYAAYARYLAIIGQIRGYRHGLEMLEEEITTL